MAGKAGPEVTELAHRAVTRRGYGNDVTPVFADWLVAHLGDEAQHARFPDDLLLVFACLRGDPSALRELEVSFLSHIPAHVRRLDPSPAFGFDVRQSVAVALLGLGRPEPKLLQYTGRGPLTGWLRVVAMREGLAALRARRATESVDAEALPEGGAGPEGVVGELELTALVQEALGEVIESLPEDDRTILRLHYVDNLTLEESARAMRFSRATVARVAAKARDRVARRLRQALRDRHKMGESSVRHVLDRLGRGDLDVSLATCLRGEQSTPS